MYIIYKNIIIIKGASQLTTSTEMAIHNTKLNKERKGRKCSQGKYCVMSGNILESTQENKTEEKSYYYM